MAAVHELGEAARTVGTEVWCSHPCGNVAEIPPSVRTPRGSLFPFAVVLGSLAPECKVCH